MLTQQASLVHHLTLLHQNGLVEQRLLKSDANDRKNKADIPEYRQISVTGPLLAGCGLTGCV